MFGLNKFPRLFPGKYASLLRFGAWMGNVTQAMTTIGTCLRFTHRRVVNTDVCARSSKVYSKMKRLSRPTTVWDEHGQAYIDRLYKHNKRSLCTKFERNPVGVVRVTAPSLFTSKMAARPPFIYLTCIILRPYLFLA